MTDCCKECIKYCREYGSCFSHLAYFLRLAHIQNFPDDTQTYRLRYLLVDLSQGIDGDPRYGVAPHPLTILVIRSVLKVAVHWLYGVGFTHARSLTLYSVWVDWRFIGGIKSIFVSNLIGVDPVTLGVTLYQYVIFGMEYFFLSATLFILWHCSANPFPTGTWEHKKSQVNRLYFSMKTQKFLLRNAVSLFVSCSHSSPLS